MKKGLRLQAEGVLTLSGHCQQLYAAQMQLVDLLPDSPLTSIGRDAEREKDGKLYDCLMQSYAVEILSFSADDMKAYIYIL